jgi:hypothetical protein
MVDDQTAQRWVDGEDYKNIERIFAILGNQMPNF